MAKLVESRPLSGFKDVLPEDALVFESKSESLRKLFRSFGYTPIDTPCMYKYETLTGGKAGIDKQMFDWRKKSGNPEKEGEHVALRFDLTVPLARYIATNKASLTFPFKRYDIAKVWRGENPQKGRYREFYQCDFDIVGTDAKESDLETLLVVHDSLIALGTPAFQIQLNDRRILDGLLRDLSLSDKTNDILRVVDKYNKHDVAKFKSELQSSVGVTEKESEAIALFISLSDQLEVDVLLTKLSEMLNFDKESVAGVERLSYLIKSLQQLRPDNDRFKVNLSIARGLGYYTSTVFETFLVEHTELGSICSGGRYDNLASLYMKDVMPGVGASIGLSRLMPVLKKESSMIDGLLILTVDKSDSTTSIRLADMLRFINFPVEVFMQRNSGSVADLSKQMRWANTKGYKWVLIVKNEEDIVFRNMETGEQDDMTFSYFGGLGWEHFSNNIRNTIQIIRGKDTHLKQMIRRDGFKERK